MPDAWPAYVADAAPGAEVHSAATRLSSGNTKQWAWKASRCTTSLATRLPASVQATAAVAFGTSFSPVKQVAAERPSNGYTY
ncbi:MAG: hypothetical protein R3E56_08530 [Burkholderiaceae bacterium]